MSVVEAIKRLLWPQEDKLPPGELRFLSELSARVIRANGKVSDMGVISRRVVTNAFVNYLVDALQTSDTAIDLFYYHDCGTGTTTEAATQTALTSPFGGSRSSGSRTEGASANIYKTVATITFASSFAITEHGVFSATAAGIMMDRSSHAAINVASDDSIEYTYQLTCSAGG